MWLVQISDIHNSNNYKIKTLEKIVSEMSNSINEYIKKDDLIMFIICGDIINKGDSNGFKSTLDFLDDIKNNIKSNNIEYIVCPGNHDIVNNSFLDLNKFIFKLTNDSRINFENNSVNIKKVEDIEFIVINSSFHLDYNYGKIDLLKLSEVIKKRECKDSIIILHHHLIPIREGENSTIVNTYEFFKLLESQNVLAILHGHQHMKVNLEIGGNLSKIIGVGSILSEIETNYNNQFNLIEIDNGEIKNITEFKFHKDEMGDGTLGKFIKSVR